MAIIHSAKQKWTLPLFFGFFGWLRFDIGQRYDRAVSNNAIKVDFITSNLQCYCSHLRKFGLYLWHVNYVILRLRERWIFPKTW